MGGGERVALDGVKPVQRRGDLRALTGVELCERRRAVRGRFDRLAEL